MRTGRIFCVSCLIFLASALAFGQGIVTGSISGTILDPQGAVVPGATIRATQVATNRVFTTTSSTGGVVQLPSLPPGAYDVHVDAKGFAFYEIHGVFVEVGKDTSLGPLSLQVSNTAETITVEGTAPLVESTTDQLSVTFDSKQVEEVPLGNTYDSFVLFTPGVSTAGSGAFSNNNGAELSINGQRARSNNYQLDGQNNNDNTIGGPSIFFGNQDNIAELQVVTNYDAEYGRNLGGVVNYITKGGTNSFHGTGFEFWQGDTFDSLENQEKSPLLGFCAPGQSTSTGCAKPVVPQFVQNQFGGTVGGPIKRDKLWFFGSTNLQRSRSSGSPFNSAPALTPTANGIQQLAAAFPGDPAVTMLQQWGAAMLKFGNPQFSNVQNVTVAANTFGPAAPIEMGSMERFLQSPFNDYEATGRIDYQISDKDRFFGRYIFQQTSVVNEAFLGSAAAAAGQVVNVPGRGQQIGLDYTHTFSPSLLNGIRFGYSRSSSLFQGGGFANCNVSDLGSCPPQVTILDTNFMPVGQFEVFPQGRIINVYELQDNASYVHGKHVMKWGGQYDKQRSPNYGLFGNNGVFLYPDFNSFIANTPLINQIVFGQPVLRFKENDLALYYQDDWRVRDNLTLNLGLRWEFYQQASNLLHDESVAQQKGPDHLWDQSLPLNLTTVPKLPNHYRNYGPVVGFAWTPHVLPNLLGRDKTVIRGGFRIAYDFAYYNLATNVQQTAPFSNATGVFQNGNPAGLPNVATMDGTSIGNALFPLVPSGGNPGLSSELQFGPNFRNPYSEQWNLGIQRQITNNMALEIRYVGNHDIGNYQEINGNPDVLAFTQNGFGKFVPANMTACTTPGVPGTSGQDQFGNPVGYANCNFGNVTEYANTGYSIYHGLQSQFRLQNWHGFTGELSYTWSHDIDNTSEAFSSQTGTVNAIAQSPFDLSRAERGNSLYDFPNDFTALWVYDLPIGKGQSGLMGRLLGGWEINGTYRYSSGQPWTVEQNAGQGLCDATNFTGASSIDACRPFIGNLGAPLTSVGQCTDPAAPGCGLVSLATGSPIGMNQAHFVINDLNAEQFFGTPFSPLGRNTERGPAISTVNLAVFKNFKIREGLTFQLQAEAFNAFNHQWLGQPDTNANDAGTQILPGLQAFGTNILNGNGGDVFAGNTNTDGIGRRRLQFGGKIIF
ncbi:MAG TPA: carboxypeptidase regulatory-like domain-containing protein [Terriglobales bacterium]|nr:carboxypeptidase regulatory-like domain-containing protein [Terriglobales bacterium]